MESARENDEVRQKIREALENGVRRMNLSSPSRVETRRSSAAAKRETRRSVELRRTVAETRDGNL